MATWQYRGVIVVGLLVQLFMPAKIGSALASQQTAPDDAYTGVELLRQCKDAIREGEPGYAPTPSGTMCIGYLDGFIAGFIVTERFYQAESHSMVAPMCLPKGGITGEQAVQIVVKWLSGHPQFLDLDEGLLVQNAFQEAFPC